MKRKGCGEQAGPLPRARRLLAQVLQVRPEAGGGVAGKVGSAGRSGADGGGGAPGGG